MSFTCPRCRESHFGSMRMEDGTYRRYCNGHTLNGARCNFSWPEADDALYGLEPINEAPAVGQAPPFRRKKVQVKYFTESGKYYSSDTYWSEKQHHWDIADELHEMFAKGERPGLQNNPGGGLGEYIAHCETVEADGLPGVPFVVTQESQREYMAKKPARIQLKIESDARGEGKR